MKDMSVQIGKYKRPGIFIEEHDNSIITSPIVEGIVNMVIGVSKKGPINTPVLLKTTSDLESVFGQLDRGLERKGSFFHRTISKMLQTTSVYAINLLATDDDLDTIEYKSMSAASNYKNDVIRNGAYRRFFDTTGFWKRDTESFINLTKDNTGYSERAFNLTNLSDKNITTFIFKSKKSGYDRTLVEWYGSVEKMPPYVNQNDYASDYMVDIIVVGGDWSNYDQLSIDPRWSSYFNTHGLRKDQLSNFANNRNITLLSYYEGVSLIPYFRDGSGRNIFIETIINRDTNKTGLFCSFNSDLVEKDYNSGLLDLIGNNLVGVDDLNLSIDFLSYKDTISESVAFTSKPLDLPGNVTGILGSTFSIYGSARSDAHAYGYGYGSKGPSESTSTTTYPVINEERTGWYAEGYVNNVLRESASYNGSTASISIQYNADSDLNSYAVIGGKRINILATASLSISSSSYPVTSTTQSYYAAFTLNSTGAINKVITTVPGTNPSVGTTDIVLGTMSYSVRNGYFATASISMSDMTVNTSAFVEMTYGTGSNDYYVTDLGSGSVKVVFNNTANTPSVTNYKQYRRIKMFNNLVNLLSGSNKDKMTMIINTNYDKKSLSSMTVTSIVTSTSQNKSFVLNTGLSSSDITMIIKGGLLFYTLDNEYILGESSVTTKDEVADISGEGVIGKYSSPYTKYISGDINTGDFFFSNILSTTSSVIFLPGEDAISGATQAAGNDYIVFQTSVDPGLSSLDEIYVPDSSLNATPFTITSVSGLTSSLATLLGYGAGYYAYEVEQNTTAETLSSVSNVFDYLEKNYIEAYNVSGVVTMNWMDSLLESSQPLQTYGITNLDTLYVQSLKSNFKQTIEIEVPTGYTSVPNKILVNGSRYTEVKIGDFLEAEYDSEALVDGEVARKLTRIISKKLYSGDTSLVEITCDSTIKTYDFNGDLQTERYTTIEDYVTTYKAITLKGFRIRLASLPDGSEERQDEILNIVAKGTPLFRAITNKEAIDFRYLIDSFGLGLTERSKQQLVDICGDRLDCFGFINMPSIKSFKNSTSPTFIDSDKVLSVEFLSKGGDPESNPAFLYSFGDGAGTSATGYFTPYVSTNDNGRPLFVPPSSYVATTYMRKHITNVTSMTPWTIAAGVTNGKVTNIAGLEIDFTPTDIEFLNQAQMNPIVFKRNRGYIIETENTAQTLYKSSLSYIHSREVLIELERELSRMLLDFQWKYNTPEIRAEIKLRADVICETYVNKNGLYNYFNKIDEENNTSDIIDSQMGVLDTYVEIIKGMGIIVNNITILRTGAIQSGGFIIP
jgi:hypothetical protein